MSGPLWRIDVAGVAVCLALTVLLGTHWLAFALGGYLAVNLALIVVWLVCTAWILRRHGPLVDGRVRGREGPSAG